jgi:DNA polymerase-3 subunit epsilon
MTEYLRGAASLEADRLENTPLIAVDLEMTGLDADKDQIIALGWTQIDGGRIHFASNRHLLIQTGQSVGQSATIHELTDDEVAQGEPIENGLQALFEAAHGRLWLFHHASLDVAFLQQACRSWAGVALPLMAIDTMQLELTLRRRRGLPVSRGDLHLGNLRKRYHLPEYAAHNALTDACATAELLLAIAQHVEPLESLRLRPQLQYF